MKIAVLVSGGVDSSVALHMLKNAGHDVTAFYLKIWLEDELSFLGNCPWEDDLSFVQQVCAQLDVPLQIVSLQQEYWDAVVSYTIDQAKNGYTPNPDVLCNQFVKFDAFFKKISSEYQKVATGHYAWVQEHNNITQLICAPDPIKDQTYFLSHLNQEQLCRALFPLGKMTKQEVRAYAIEHHLPTAQRKDSYGICFLGKISFNDFLAHHLDKKTGELREYETNKVVGSHDGFWFFTLGQRKGIKLSGGPWFVVSKDITNNIVYISKNYHSAEKERKSFKIEQIHWIENAAPSKQLLESGKLNVKIRHGAHKTACTILLTDKNNGIVDLAEKDQGIAPGQFAVFYDNDRCLGCAVIAMPDAPTELS